MAVPSRVCFMSVFASLLFAMITLPAAAQAQSSSAPSPAPTSDGTSIDQGIAYVLMLVALVLTYIIHFADLGFEF